MNIPQPIEALLFAIQTQHEAYFAGGCVRDHLLGRLPKDYDIATAATPEEVKSLLLPAGYRIVDTGLKHGTVTVVLEDGHHVEVTTFRIDGEYEDSRRPSSVEYTRDVLMDVKRRDFTINSLLYDGEEIIDHLDGQNDLDMCVIRAVGVPNERFHEDALRILRGIRFSCQLGFTITSRTYESMRSHGYLLEKISGERKKDELCKIILSDYPDTGIRLLNELDLLQYIIPELIPCIGFEQCNPHHRYDVFNHIMEAVKHTPPILEVRLAALFHDIGKPLTFSTDAKGVGHFFNHYKEGATIADLRMRELKFDNTTREKVVFLVKHHQQDVRTLQDKRRVKRFLNRVGIAQVYNLLELMQADRIAHMPPHNFTPFAHCRDLIKTILEEKLPFDINALDVDGHALIELGLKPGPQFKEILNHLLHCVIEDTVVNKREELLQEIKRYLSRG